MPEPEPNIVDLPSEGKSVSVEIEKDSASTEEEAVSEGMNCGCGQDPCKTYGKDHEKLIVMVR